MQTSPQDHGHVEWYQEEDLELNSFDGMDGDDDQDDGRYSDEDRNDDIDDDEEAGLLLDDPDLPLTMTPSGQRATPRWLTDRNRRCFSLSTCSQSPAWQWAASSPLLRAIANRLRTLLRPRLSWRYMAFAAAGLYVAYCFVTWQPFFSSPLPAYSGPHAVGTMDVEVPLHKPVRISDTLLRASRGPAFEVETVLFSLYYPTAKAVRSKKARHPWAPRPLSLTAEGYARIAHVDNFVVRPIFTFALWLLVGGVGIPAKVDVPLLGVDGDVGSDDGDNDKFPVMVFSHGMASSRTDYTHFLGQLASRGYIVAAIEHRDGSCPGSLVKVKNKKDRRVLLLRESDLEAEPPLTTAKLKEEQLAFRDAEISATIRVLQGINEGRGFDEVFKLNSRSEGHALAAWAERLDFEHLTISGHSYGATGALQALKTANSTANPAIGGIILDPGKESGQLNSDIPVPILVVHSSSWSSQHSIFFGRPHFDTVRDLVRAVADRVGASWFLTSLGTAHPSITDAPLLQPLLLGWATSTTMPVREALDEYVKVTLDFFNFLERGAATGVLREETTHEKYGKWVNDDRKKSFPEDMAKHWEVHVSPQHSK
ncbi:platelet-activating factor acetylhydrolase, isoform II-domain-containing protein [Dactylonectria estremocensis]|uniref:Putative phospholipase n=1 Tax=Dactylonectria estremocensis TaxID=1079267 RepID=A0A9P9IN24_9HYPO|nr:platelet-activating factor acetylhydrolase, isoform II-domain-containing protein [Dactylonectria estremocensis]